MVIRIERDHAAVSRTAAEVVSSAVGRRPSLRLGLAAGTTPLGLYQELVHRHRAGQLDCSHVVVFSLDEFLGLPPDHVASFHSFFHRHLLDQANFDPRHVHLINGAPPDDPAAYCAGYEQAIRDAGGIDLQILGLGLNGHLGFNEPGSGLAMRMRPVLLSDETRATLRAGAGSHEDLPDSAFTLGLGTIREAHMLLLLASGTDKAAPLANALEGPVTASLPASVLQCHPNALVLCDEEASAMLARRDYYRRASRFTALAH
jgi:glucosamine-6-phosphate deaminase